ncbi:MAG TPA: sulfate ABC transporter substrate-binding protein [Isosphaeraceae bacterium]
MPTGQGAREDVLTIGAYSVVREVLHEALLPAFAARWKAETGREVRFEESYNGSGAQSRAIAAGFDADIAILSLEDDVTPLVKAGLVSERWNKGPDRGMVTRSLVVVAVRPGNPKGIHDWPDLAKPDVGVLYPDQKTSGGARWNINAIYGAGLLGDGKQAKPDAEAAKKLLTAVQANVVNMDSSGRQSLATFERGIGDAAVTYENELRLRLGRGGSDAGLESIVPPRTLLIEGPAALVDASVERHGNRRLAQAFLDFMRDKEGQAILAEYGFRPIDEAPPPGTFTMSELGGWSKVKADVYGPKGVWTSIFTEREKAKMARGGSR